MAKKRKGRVSQETFDDFLANEGMLEACEDHAIKDIIAAQSSTSRTGERTPRGKIISLSKTRCRSIMRTNMARRGSKGRS
jgi:antitoxin HicB